jgi:hypothetical protein
MRFALNTPSGASLLLALVLFTVPSGLLAGLGVTEQWELELLRISAVFIVLYAWATLPFQGLAAPHFSDPLVRSFSTVALFTGVGYFVRGDGFLLLVTFSLIVGISLNRFMKRMDLAYERAQSRIERPFEA